MRKRFIYLILFGIPGLILALIISFVISGLVLGFLWLFVFGDDPWPSSVETISSLLFVFTFLVAWTAILAAGFVTGKRLEKDTTMNKSHILASVGISILFILFIVLHQLSVGNIGPKSDGEFCMDYCIQQGYSASSTPPQNSGEKSCSCLDDSGSEVIKIPIDSIKPVK